MRVFYSLHLLCKLQLDLPRTHVLSAQCGMKIAFYLFFNAILVGILQQTLMSIIFGVFCIRELCVINILLLMKSG